MKIIIDTRYIKKHSAQSIVLSFTCRDFYIMKDKILFNNYVSIALDDIIRVKAIINKHDSTLYDDEKKKVIPTKLDNNYISAKLDNVKNVLEEIKENVVVNDM